MSDRGSYMLPKRAVGTGDLRVCAADGTVFMRKWVSGMLQGCPTCALRDLEVKPRGD